MPDKLCCANHVRLILALFVALTALGAVKHFVSKQFKYELDVPAGWNIDQTPSGVPVLFNYKSSMAGPQGLFPEDGAEIRLMPLQEVQVVTNARTMDEWINHNYGPAYRNVSKKRLPDFGANGREPREITEVQAEFERDPIDEELQHDFSCSEPPITPKRYKTQQVPWSGQNRTLQIKHLFSFGRGGAI